MSQPVNVSYGMPLCGSCHFWTRPAEGTLGKHGRCRAAVHDVHGSHSWDGTDLDWWKECNPDVDLAVIQHAPMLVEDGSGYKAELYTLPSHYCAMHAYPFQSPEPK